MSVDEHIIKDCDVISNPHYGWNGPSNTQNKAAKHIRNIPEDCVKTLTELKESDFQPQNLPNFSYF